MYSRLDDMGQINAGTAVTSTSDQVLHLAIYRATSLSLFISSPNALFATTNAIGINFMSDCRKKYVSS